MKTAKKPLTAAQKRERRFLSAIRAAVKAAATEAIEHRPYEWGYSVLTIRFAEGSEPAALSIPYRPWENRADISVNLKVMAAEVTP